MTRFRLVIYAFRFRTLVADLQSHVAKGFRIILVLPENEDEKTVLLSKLSKVIHSGTLFLYPNSSGSIFWGSPACSGTKSTEMARAICFFVSNNFRLELG
nr:hypothetical protein [Escherichia coli]